MGAAYLSLYKECPGVCLPIQCHHQAVRDAAIASLGFPDIPYGYAANWHYFSNRDDSTNLEPKIESPSMKIMVAENISTEVGTAAFDFNSTNGFPNNSFANHLLTMNCLFGDGHVKSLRPTVTVTPFNMWGAFADNTAAQGTSCAAAAPMRPRGRRR